MSEQIHPMSQNQTYLKALETRMLEVEEQVGRQIDDPPVA